MKAVQKKKKKCNVVRCSECGATAVYHESSAGFYTGTDYGPVYACSKYPDCVSWVGVHRNSGKALGTPAGAATRKLRSQVHAAMDPIWKSAPQDEQTLWRSAVYAWLHGVLGLPDGVSAHVGHLNAAGCRQVLVEFDTEEGRDEMALTVQEIVNHRRE